jgi:long-chain acyl-CoA synthetase
MHPLRRFALPPLWPSAGGERTQWPSAKPVHGCLLQSHTVRSADRRTLEQRMSYLWDLSNIKPQTVVLPGETIPAMFWNAVERGRQRLAAPEGPGHLAQLDLEAGRPRRWSEIGHGLLALGFAPARNRLHPVQHQHRMGAQRPGGAQRQRRGQRHLPHRRGRAGALPVRRLAHHRAVRGRRRAAGQGAGGARAACPSCARSWCSTWKACATCTTRAGDEPGRAARAGPRARQTVHPNACKERTAAVQPDDLAILVYTSGTTGKPKGAMHSHKGWSTRCAATTR